MKQLQVLLQGNPVGTLAQDARGQIWFEYHTHWVQHGFALSPMPDFALKQGAFKARNHHFQGLHGVFNDALPDGWGLLLMDRAFKQQLGRSPHDISPLDRLAYLGQRAMGAMEFEPHLGQNIRTSSALSLQQLAENAILVQEGSAGEVLQALQIHGGSPGGARPKVTVALNPSHPITLRSGFADLPEGYAHWIVKFKTQHTDPDCMGRLELAYAHMAKAAGIAMPPTLLLSAQVKQKTEDFFAVQRFDRLGSDKRHVLSLGGMLDASHRLPSLDYTELLKAVHFATRNMQDVEQAFRLMAFNVLAHNKDDHVKNFAFVYNGQAWQLSPAFDLTFSTGLNNQHTTAIAGEGRPSLKAIQHVAEQAGVKTWKKILAHVFEAVTQWPYWADQLGVDPQLARQYQNAFETEPCYATLINQKI